MLLPVGMVSAGVPFRTVEQQVCAVLVGQSAATNNNTSSEDRARQAAELLSRARQAMEENDWDAAEALISRAEALDVQYSPLHLGDTPRKARRDLERKRANAGPLKPSQLFAPLGFGKDKQSPSKDPFAGRPVEPPPAGSVATEGDSEQIKPLPKVEQNSGGAQPAQVASDSPLRQARLALAVGDVRRALEFVKRARSLPPGGGPQDDTPEKVESLLQKYQELSTLDKGSELYARLYARNMMEQADGLARWGELDEAERLARRAAMMPVTYGPFEQKPQELLERISAARRAGRRPAMSTGAGYATATAPPSPAVARQQAVELVRQAREAIATGQLERAEALALQAEKLGLPDSAFAPGEDRPALVLLDLQQLRERQAAAGRGGPTMPAGGAGPTDGQTKHALYDPARDPTRNEPVGSRQPTYPGPRAGNPRLAQDQSSWPPAPEQPRSSWPPPPQPQAAPGGETPGMALFRQGEEALRAHDVNRAYEFFTQAARYINELDPLTAQRLQDHLQLLSASNREKPPRATAGTTGTEELAAQQQILWRQIAAEVAQRESTARSLRESDPKGALSLLEEARKKVESSGLDRAAREQLLRRVDRTIAETQQYIEQNRPNIELAEKNRRIQQEVDREKRVKVEVQEKLATLIDQFNRLMDEERFEEAEVIAKRAAELDPDNPVVVQVLWQAKFVRNFRAARSIQSQAEEGFVRAMEEVDRAKIPFAGDKNPMVFPNDGKDWEAFTKRRLKYAGDAKRPRTERELEIEKKLRTPVSLQFTNAPLSKVLDYLAKIADVNLHLDPQGLAEEGVTSDTPVTIELRSEIMLKSALNLILEPLHLSYVIKDEVLKITSEQMRDGQVYTVTYNVADLVVPIPNFVPAPMGLQSAYHDALGTVGFGGQMPFGSSTATPLAVVANREGKQGSAALNPALLAQVSSGSQSPHPGAPPRNAPVGAGPGGLGGGVQADFDSLIDLITSTIRPTTWDTVGGPGSIAPFETNLSIVVSQTQDVHEEIVDLLEQLRRLQDLQVTIEVRFITLNDNFFERIGVDFDFDINDNIDGKNVLFGARDPNQGVDYVEPQHFQIGQGVRRNIVDQDDNRTVTVGLSNPGVFNADLDIPFTQNSFALAVPQFGGFDATAGAQLGFAILSDIEAYFFISAAQGDRRSNVLQAPKVTLFNGQQAYVSDTSQSPFVISVIPVVGDFAAAQQPVIVVLSEGTFMTVQAVVSNDRRFVRLTVVPFFSKIGDVRTFTFTGTTTTTTDTTREGLQSAATDPSKLWNKRGDTTTKTSSGTTVQLPTFSYVTVTTTVSVPDGGTVLLGGIKRLSEGRSEFGVPMLNKLPYINRLFKNVAVGRETQSLMMMVTPRIIIQEEEEEKLGIQTPP